MGVSIDNGDKERISALEQVRSAVNLVKSLLNSGGKPREKCVLSPWDEMAYFDAPRVTNVTCPGATVTRIVSSNPNRVVLVLGAQQIGQGTAGISPIADFGPSNFAGIQINNYSLPIIFTQKDHGPLAQIEWYCYVNAGTGYVTVVEVTLKEWPTNKGKGK